MPFNVALVLPAQLTILAVALVPTVIVVWLAFTDWQPTDAIPWYRAETVWFWNFYDLWYDERFVNAVLRTFFVVGVCVAIELVLALGLALLFLEEWRWKKIAVSVIILPMMIIPVDAANAFFMLFNEHGPINHLVSLALGHPFEFSWLSNPTWAMVPIMLVRDLAVDALDVPARPDRLDSVATKSDTSRDYARRFAAAHLFQARAAAAPACAWRSGSDPLHRDVQDIRSRLHADTRAAGRGDRDDLDVHVQRSLRLFPHGLYRSRSAYRAYPGGRDLPRPRQVGPATWLMGSVTRRQSRWVVILKRVTVVIAMLISFFPIFWLISTAFKPFDEWASWPPVWVSGHPTLQNFRIVFFPEAAREFAAAEKGSLDYKVSGSAWKAFGDSALIASLATAFSISFGTLAAYSIARFATGGPSFPFQFLTVRMMPPIAVVVPIVALFAVLRLSDTYFGMILAYTAFTLPFSIWMIRSFIEEIPSELEGVAMVHGASRAKAFLTVTLPLVRGGVLATALFVFILNWSEFLFALVLTSGRMLTVTLQVANYVSASSGKLYGVQAAMGTVSTIPVIVFGYLIQKHLVRGLTFGAVKR